VISNSSEITFPKNSHKDDATKKWHLSLLVDKHGGIRPQEQDGKGENQNMANKSE